MSQGWECPRCGIVHAPWVARCPCVRPAGTEPVQSCLHQWVTGTHGTSCVKCGTVSQRIREQQAW